MTLAVARCYPLPMDKDQLRYAGLGTLLALIAALFVYGPALWAEWEYASSDDYEVKCFAAEIAASKWADLGHAERAKDWESKAALNCLIAKHKADQDRVT